MAEAEKTIIVNKLVKNFEVSEKKEGVWGTLSSIISPKKKIVRALKGISFSITQGELVGFIGPNGAGKTTTLKVLSGLLFPTSGSTFVLGYDPWKRDSRYLKQISLVMGQKNQLWWDLPAQETFVLNKAIYEIPDRVYQQTLNELVEMLDVRDLLGIAVRRLSLGQRMRLELIAALLHRPKVLFLDEPTIGLDVVGQQKLRDFISQYNKKYRATILLTSHNMDDVLDLAKRVIVIDRGEILFDGNLQELIGNFAKEKTIRVSLAREADLKNIEKLGKVKRMEFPEVVLSVSRAAVAFVAAELLQNLPVADLTIEEEPIESIIRKVFRGEIIKKKRK
ncbi:ATP-binding cassette domain-containing protein [Candidatus Woesebacteria bacterium]|nr:ATP-binding cassette domain-containing protein [Candidatus Woesebacteria bacterium]